jgi:hypothetical protein
LTVLRMEPLAVSALQGFAIGRGLQSDVRLADLCR